MHSGNVLQDVRKDELAGLRVVGHSNSEVESSLLEPRHSHVVERDVSAGVRVSERLPSPVVGEQERAEIALGIRGGNGGDRLRQLRFKRDTRSRGGCLAIQVANDFAALRLPLAGPVHRAVETRDVIDDVPSRHRRQRRPRDRDMFEASRDHHLHRHRGDVIDEDREVRRLSRGRCYDGDVFLTDVAVELGQKRQADRIGDVVRAIDDQALVPAKLGNPGS